MHFTRWANTFRSSCTWILYAEWSHFDIQCLSICTCTTKLTFAAAVVDWCLKLHLPKCELWWAQWSSTHQSGGCSVSSEATLTETGALVSAVKLCSPKWEEAVLIETVAAVTGDGNCSVCSSQKQALHVYSEAALTKVGAAVPIVILCSPKRELRRLYSEAVLTENVATVSTVKLCSQKWELQYPQWSCAHRNEGCGDCCKAALTKKRAAVHAFGSFLHAIGVVLHEYSVHYARLQLPRCGHKWAHTHMHCTLVSHYMCLVFNLGKTVTL